ncbi:hypothetical protein JXB37_02545 [candidate division WOR-3 bacterium]|nr:hypothetical protein [candidate division WOR-3 bacterium]
MKRAGVMLAAVLACLVLACATTSYVRPDEVTEWDADYTDTDMKMLTEKMVLSLSEAEVSGSEGKPVLAFLRIGNRTSQHVDTEGIADKIMVQLVKLGKFRVVDRELLKKQAQEIALVESQRIDVEGAVRLGSLVGADYFLTGDLYSIEKVSPSKELKYYNLTMRLVDTRTSEIVWAEEKEIKKSSTRGWYD